MAAIFAAARRWGYTMALEHVGFGTILGEDGRPIKTREGEPIKLEALLDEAEERARAVVREKNPSLSDAEQEHIARGEIADEEAIARALTEGWIAGAALDAFTREPLPAESPLRGVDPERLILTPHNVSHSEAGRRANLKLALDQILAAGRGEAPAHCVNPQAIPRWRTP